MPLMQAPLKLVSLSIPFSDRIDVVAVTFSNFGLDALEVLDNGVGIAPEDMPNVAKRNHTSKITHDIDIYKSQSRGFRGEALHCLAALSNELTITSRWGGDHSGMGLRFSWRKGNEEPSSERVAVNFGTIVRISGLLAGLPVRVAEWRRNPKRHFAKAINMLQSYALATPEIKYRCVHGPQTLFSSSGSDNMSKAVAEAFGGGDTSGQLRQQSWETTGYSVDLHFTNAGRKAADRQFLFINRRPCELPKLFKRLNEVSRSHGWTGYATVIVHVTSTELVDFNLTPDKRQVLINFDAELIDDVSSRFGGELTAVTEIPLKLPSSIQSSLPIASTLSDPLSQSVCCSVDLPTSQTVVPPAPRPVEVLEHASCFVSEPLNQSTDDKHLCTLERSAFGMMKVIGQFNCGFILTRLAIPDGDCQVFIIDQHASDERFRLETLQRNLTHSVQTLLQPINLDQLPLKDRLFVEAKMANLKMFGFQAQLSEPSIKLVACPFVAGLQLGLEDLIEMIALMRSEELQGLHSLSRVAEALGYRACRSAIMIGDPLTIAQMTQVVRNLEGLDKPWICAHGRPTVRLLYTHHRTLLNRI